MKKYHIIFVLLIHFVGYTQWSVTNSNDYKGNFLYAATNSLDNSTVLVLSINSRDRTGFLYINGKNIDFNIKELENLSYSDYAVSMKFDDSPKVYYPNYSMLQVNQDYFSLFLSDGFNIDNRTKGFDNPRIGIDLKSENKENLQLLWKAKGAVGKIEDFTDKLKSSSTMYLAFWTNSRTYYLTYNLKGSSKAINTVFKPKYNSSFPVFQSTIRKHYANSVLGTMSDNPLN